MKCNVVVYIKSIQNLPSVNDMCALFNAVCVRYRFIRRKLVRSIKYFVKRSNVLQKANLQKVVALTSRLVVI